MAEYGDSTDDEARRARSAPIEAQPQAAPGDRTQGIEARDTAVPQAVLQRNPAGMLGDPRIKRSLHDQPRADMLLHMQSTFGNAHTRRVQRMLGQARPGARQRPVQRVEIGSHDTKYDESILRSPEAPTDAAPNPGYRPKTYTGTTHYHMTRTPDAVNVNVRILFVDPNSTVNGGQIPDTDTARRNWANDICANLVGNWNNKFDLVSRQQSMGERIGRGALGLALGTIAGDPAAGFDWATRVPIGAIAGTPPTAGAGAGARAGTRGGDSSPDEVRLPLVFSATPVFDAAAAEDKYDHRVYLHGGSDVADPSAPDPNDPYMGTPGRTRRKSVIDAGNWYTGKAAGAYSGASDEAIYAHEYGHLLGIPDEYSQSNPSMHTLFHKISPTDEVQMNTALDRAGATRIILHAMWSELVTNLNSQARHIATLIHAQHGVIERQLWDAMRESWVGGATATMLPLVNASLSSQPKAQAEARDALELEARRIDFETIVGKQVGEQFRVRSLVDLLKTQFLQALRSRWQAVNKIDIPYEGGSVNVKLETTDAVGSGADSALDTAAAAAADLAVGKPEAATAGGGGRTPPPVYPSASLLGRMSAMPARWGTVSDLFADSQPLINLQVMNSAMGLVSHPSFAARVHNSPSAMRAYLRNKFAQITSNVAQFTVQSFVSKQVTGLINAQADELSTMINEELDSHAAGTATATGTSASAGATPPDALRTAVRTMAERANTIQSTPETDSTGAANSPHIRYTVNALMGSNHDPEHGLDMRMDYAHGMRDAFNSNQPELKHSDEEDFRVEPHRASAPGGAGAPPTPVPVPAGAGAS